MTLFQPPPEDEPFGPRIVVAVPAYNEDRFIGSLVLKLRRYFTSVLVIDDGSKDETGKLAVEAGATVYRHAVNMGKSEGVNTAFRVAREMQAEALVLLDGDGQHQVEDALTVLAPILAGETDVVVGSRYLGTRSETPLHRIIGQQALNGLTNLSSGVGLTDTQSGLRAFSMRAISLLSFRSAGFSVESEMQFLVRSQQLRVTEVPITVLYREPDKRNPVAHGAQVVNGVIRLLGHQRPLMLFGGGGAFLTVLGVALGVEVVAIYVRTSELAVGYALITVLLILAGMVSLFAGLMLNSLTDLILDVQQQVTLMSQQVLPPLMIAELKEARVRRRKIVRMRPRDTLEDVHSVQALASPPRSRVAEGIES